jgi:FkbM family methyltransferase
MEQKSILEFLKSDTPVARLVADTSSVNYRKMSWLGYRKRFFSLKEFFILLLPTRFAIKRKYLSRQWEFLNQETKEELRDYFDNDQCINLFGRPFDPAPNYTPAIHLILEIITQDQYHARDFLKDDSVVIDAGANMGIFSIFAASLAPRGKIYAFEPVRGTFKSLVKNIQEYSNVALINKGLGDRTARKKILNLGVGDEGSVMEDSPFYKNSKDRKGILEDVEVTTIDDFVKENNLPRVDFIKIDTEGYEANILRGAAETIKKFKPVIAMSAYHNPGDKKDLPRIVQSLVPEYVCELHKDAEEDFICYIPN